MTKFVYKMQNILDIKFKLENQAKTSYANARAKLEEEEEKLRTLKAKREEYEENYRRYTRVEFLCTGNGTDERSH